MTNYISIVIAFWQIAVSVRDCAPALFLAAFPH